MELKMGVRGRKNSEMVQRTQFKRVSNLQAKQLEYKSVIKESKK